MDMKPFLLKAPTEFKQTLQSILENQFSCYENRNTKGDFLLQFLFSAIAKNGLMASQNIAWY